MRVAVTGAAGFTGRFVMTALRNAGLDGVSLQADLTDKQAIETEIASTSFSCVIHLAGQAFVAGEDWSAFYSTNQIGTFNLLDAIARHKRGARCILASSAQVYGPGAEGLITEDAITNPSNHYAVSKRAMELGAALWHDQLEIVIARPFNYTGVGQSVEYLLPKLVDHFRRKASLIELGNLWVKRDFGDVRSVAQAYVGLAVSRDVTRVLNIGTGIVSSIDEILLTLTMISGHHLDVQVNETLVRKNDVPMLGSNVALLRSTLPGWEPISLGDTLEWMYRCCTE